MNTPSGVFTNVCKNRTYIITIRFYSQMQAPPEESSQGVKDDFPKQYVCRFHTDCKNEREQPEIGIGYSRSRLTAVVMCFSSGYSSRVAPQRCPLRFTGRSMLASISDFECKGTTIISYMQELAEKRCAFLSNWQKKKEPHACATLSDPI